MLLADRRPSGEEGTRQDTEGRTVQREERGRDTEGQETGGAGNAFPPKEHWGGHVSAQAALKGAVVFALDYGQDCRPLSKDPGGVA